MSRHAQAGGAELEAATAVGERAYDRLYDARDRQEFNWLAELATDSYREAMRIAESLGMEAELPALRERLLHIKAVVRQLR